MVASEYSGGGDDVNRTARRIGGLCAVVLGLTLGLAGAGCGNDCGTNTMPVNGTCINVDVIPQDAVMCGPGTVKSTDSMNNPICIPGTAVSP